jgi:transposase InsO family protein
MDERVRFIAEYQTNLFTMTELCEQFGISRKTGYKLLHAYERQGPSGLAERSRRPHTSPNATGADVVKAVLACRKDHPHWGPKKLLAYLRRHQPRLRAADRWPGISTVARILAQHGCMDISSRGRRRWPSAAASRALSTAANQVWTADYKGEFRTRDGQWCYPLTVMDTFSRYLLACEGFGGPTDAATRSAFQRAFQISGLPERIRSDNGTPFAGPGVAGLSPLAVWWIRLGIGLERIERGHPEQNAEHERMHRTLKAETTRPPAANLREQQRRFATFQREYNDERPHEALEFAVPAMRYVASPRSYPRRLPPVEYPGHFTVRRVYAHGDIRWGNRRLFVSQALAHEYVGLEEVDDGIWDVCFASMRLARLNQRTGALHPRPA